MRGVLYESGCGTALAAGNCSSLSFLGPLLFPVPSRDRAVGDSSEGPHPAPMAEPDRESGAQMGGSGRAGAWLWAAGPGARGQVRWGGRKGLREGSGIWRAIAKWSILLGWWVSGL